MDIFFIELADIINEKDLLFIACHNLFERC